MNEKFMKTTDTPHATSLYATTIKIIDDILSVFTDDDFTKGMIVAIPHYVIMTAIIVYVMFADVRQAFQVTSVYFWLIIFLLGVLIINILYRGCILIKCERRYFNNREWYGGYELLRLFGIPLSNERVIIYYYLWVGLIASVVVSKLAYSAFIANDT
jgi:hypothetical protein